jgi:hypothetical protein
MAAPGWFQVKKKSIFIQATKSFDGYWRISYPFPPHGSISLNSQIPRRPDKKGSFWSHVKIADLMQKHYAKCLILTFEHGSKNLGTWRTASDSCMPECFNNIAVARNHKIRSGIWHAMQASNGFQGKSRLDFWNSF